MSRPRILVVDDDPANLGLLTRMLREAYEIETADNGEAGVAAALKAPPDLVLLDVMMPGIDGYEACRLLKADERTKDVPIIFLSASEEAVKGFAVGAVDYLQKPMRVGELRARIRTHLELCAARDLLERSNAELEEARRSLETRVAERTAELSEANQRLVEEAGIRTMAEDRLAYLVRHDPHTRLLNAQTFRTELDRHLIEASRLNRPHALVRVDLANVDELNATLGLTAGDDLIATLAATARESAPADAVVARVGGAKVAFSTPGLDAHEAAIFARSVVDVVNKKGYWKWDGVAQPIHASAAVVVAGLGEAHSSDMLMSRADRVARASSADVKVYDERSERSDKLQLLQDWSQRLRQAVTNDDFVLFHQRIVPLQGQQQGGHIEILLRMKGENGRFLAPGAFFPFVEELGYATMIDRWVVSAVIKWLRTDASTGTDVCAVNLSGQSLNDPAFAEELLTVIEAAPDVAKRLCFEITESVAIVNLDEVSNFVAKLRALGCQASLDDFGAGFASYGYLKSLPTDYLKIDGQFVKDMVTDEVNCALVRSMNDVGHATGKITIAEFVEDLAIRDLLQELGVDYAQGWGIHKPERLV